MIRTAGIIVCLFLALCQFTACGKKDGDAPKDKAASEAKDTTSKDSAKDQKGGEKLKDGQWPASIYSKYGIDEFTTKGKLVYTEFLEDGPYRYQVNYHGVTREELNAWVDKLIAKGFKIHERDKQRLAESKYNHDTMIYLANEKQPYRIRLSYDFNQDMEIEYYDENPNPAFTVTEKEDGQAFIYYNLAISLNPLNTEQEIKGSFDSLGLKADDFKAIDNVRSVSMSENQNGGAINIKFYSDHFTTKEEFENCRNILAEKLAESGCTFTHTMSGKALTASDLKDNGIGSYMVEKDGKKYLLMVDPDSEFNEFGGRYGVRLTLKK